MSVEIPEPVTAASATDWSDEVDVLVVGAGMGGTCAAYAVGAAAANTALDGSGYSSGTQLGEASYFGRRAGRHAARPVTG